MSRQDPLDLFDLDLSYELEEDVTPGMAEDRRLDKLARERLGLSGQKLPTQYPRQAIPGHVYQLLDRYVPERIRQARISRVDGWK